MIPFCETDLEPEEIEDLGGYLEEGRIWLPYNVVFPIGDLDQLSRVPIALNPRSRGGGTL